MTDDELAAVVAAATVVFARQAPPREESAAVSRWAVAARLPVREAAAAARLERAASRWSRRGGPL